MNINYKSLAKEIYLGNLGTLTRIYRNIKKKDFENIRKELKSNFDENYNSWYDIIIDNIEEYAELYSDYYDLFEDIIFE